jgi:hypothetical protein
MMANRSSLVVSPSASSDRLVEPEWAALQQAQGEGKLIIVSYEIIALTPILAFPLGGGRDFS